MPERAVFRRTAQGWVQFTIWMYGPTAQRTCENLNAQNPRETFRDMTREEAEQKGAHTR